MQRCYGWWVGRDASRVTFQTFASCIIFVTYIITNWKKRASKFNPFSDSSASVIALSLSCVLCRVGQPEVRATNQLLHLPPTTLSLWSME